MIKQVKTTAALAVLSFSLAVQAEVKTVADMINPLNDAITVDKNDNIYVSNAGWFTNTGLDGSLVMSNNLQGENEVFVENLSGPLGNAFDMEGNFYVSNMNTGDIYRKDKHGRVELFSTIDSGGGIAIDQNNELFVASFEGAKIYKIDKDGNASVYSEHPLLAGGPVGLSFDEHHNLYVGNYADGKIIKISKKGEVTEIAQLAEARYNVAYLVYAAGNIYATSLRANKVFKVSLDGEVEVFAGTGAYGNGEYGDGDGENLEAKFLGPNGITTNKKQDTLYITEFWSSYVRTISLD